MYVFGIHFFARIYIETHTGSWYPLFVNFQCGICVLFHYSFKYACHGRFSLRTVWTDLRRQSLVVVLAVLAVVAVVLAHVLPSATCTLLAMSEMLDEELALVYLLVVAQK